MPRGKLRVLNLNATVKEYDVRTLFSSFGIVYRVFLARDNSGTCMGYAFVLMRDAGEASKAVNALNGIQFFDHSIHVEEYA